MILDYANKRATDCQCYLMVLHIAFNTVKEKPSQKEDERNRLFYFSGSQDEILGLNKHNEYRKVHGVPAMKLNALMSREAAEYARKIAQMGVLVHASPSERDNQGENLSMGCDNDGQTTTEATTNW